MKNIPKYLSICCTLQKLGTALFFCLGVCLGVCITCYFIYCVITTAFFSSGQSLLDFFHMGL